MTLLHDLKSFYLSGDLREGRSVSGHTLPTVILSAQNLLKGDFLKSNNSGSSPDIKRDIRSLTLDSKTKSVSNLFQNRPLPPAPSKRFSKSLDRLRFLETGQFSKGKGKTFPFHQKRTPKRAHPMLVKSSSFGGTFNKIINASQPPVPAPRKGSLDLLDKSAAFDLGHIRKSHLCHRHSKSLDTLLLLRDLSWTAYDVDIYHSYASVRSNQSDNNNEKEPSYQSVTSDEKPSSLDEGSGRLSSQGKARTLSGPPVDSDDQDEHFDEENPYASVSEEEMSKTGSSQSGRESRNSDQESNIRDSGAPSSTLEPEESTSPYASVRISQIPGLVIRPSPGEESNCNEEVLATEAESDFTIGTGSDPREDEDLKRASTHTYLELFPDSGRESIISETSSGYARPSDVLSDISEPLENTSVDADSSSDSAIKILEQCPEKKDDLVNPREEGTETKATAAKTDPRVSQLFFEDLREDEDEAKSEFGEGISPTDEHTYENSQVFQNLKHGNAFEEVEIISSEAANAQTFHLQEPRLSEEVHV